MFEIAFLLDAIGTQGLFANLVMIHGKILQEWMENFQLHAVNDILLKWGFMIL